MSHPDWRNAADYEPLRALDTADLAGEFLNRNPQYRNDHQRLVALFKEHRLTSRERDAFALRWGARFRVPRRAPALDTAGAAERRRHRCGTRRAAIAAPDR